MHNAPSVTYPVGRSLALGWLLAAVWLSGCVALAYWALLADAWTWRQSIGLGSLLLCAILAARGWLRMPSGDLCWDGQDWHFISSAGRRTASGRLTVHLAGQRHLLVRLSAAGAAPRWYWAEQSSLPQRWADLCRAVYSRAKSVAPAADAFHTAVP